MRNIYNFKELCLNLFRHFQSQGHTGFVEDVCITFIYKTDPFILTKTLAPHGLNIEESV